MPQFKVFKGSKSGDIIEGSGQAELRPNDVLIEITHSGVCGTDVHYKSADQGLGHEGVGIVKETGSNAKLFKVGDRVGWGYIHHTCGHCKWCLTGYETFCPQRQMYGEANLHQGSMGSHAVWDENYVFPIPNGISSEDAAPLMCAGATVFNALQLYNARSTDRVGIIGVGGLGHLAIQFAAKMGCEVVVFSGTDSKKEEAMKLGATEFHAMKDVKELKLEKPIDHLLVTTSAPPDWNLYAPALAPNATIYPLTVNEGNMEFPYMQLILSGLRVQGSLVAAREIHKEMLAFAAHHKIRPISQTFPMSKDGVEDAFKTLESGKMRYRGVLVA